jgi:hypothetical protein
VGASKSRETHTHIHTHTDIEREREKERRGGEGGGRQKETKKRRIKRVFSSNSCAAINFWETAPSFLHIPPQTYKKNV